MMSRSAWEIQQGLVNLSTGDYTASFSQAIIILFQCVYCVIMRNFFVNMINMSNLYLHIEYNININLVY